MISSKSILLIVSILVSSCIKQPEPPQSVPPNVMNICLTVCAKYGYTTTKVVHDAAANTYNCTCHDKKE